jgi:CPA1 family monovalent cation:H+ antiporter
VVATGLYFGRYGSRSLTAAARLRQRQIWELIVFLLTGLSFLLVGLELRPVLETLTARDSNSLVAESLAVVGVVIVVRMVWMFGVTALPGGRHLFSTNQGTPATWRETTVVGWAGMRGAISLAAALALPTTFAERDLVLFLTFAVILGTLVGQGLTLPPLIRRLGLVSKGEQDQILVADARRRLVVLALARIDDLAASTGTPEDVTERVRSGYEALLAQVDRRIDLLTDADAVGDGAIAAEETETRAFEAEVLLRWMVIETERDELDRMVAHRKVSRPVAADVRAALDIDETTMRP